MNERMRLNPAEAGAAGLQDAQALLLTLSDIEQSAKPAELLGNSLAGIVGLAADSRLDECQARKAAFCEIIGPALRDAARAADQLEALQAKCALLSASLRQAEPQASVITDSEGGEL